MTDGVHASLDNMQAPTLDPVADFAATDSAGKQLRPRNHTMLAPRQVGDQRIRSGLSTYVGPKPERVGHAPEVASQGARLYARTWRN